MLSNETWLAIVLSTVLSIPVSLAVGLAIDPIRKWMKARGKSFEEKKLSRQRSEYHRVLFFIANPEEFNQYLLWSAIHSIFGVYMFIVSMAAIFFTFALAVVEKRFGGHANRFSLVLGIVGGVAAQIIAGYFLAYGKRALDRYGKVHFFTGDWKLFPAAVRDHALEIEVMRLKKEAVWVPLKPEDRENPPQMTDRAAGDYDGAHE
jgi:hypothetical protein